MESVDLRRIAFVTRRFGDLQGIRTVVYGAALLVGISIHSLFPRDYPDPLLSIALFASLLGGAARVTLDRYYGRTFGNLAAQRTWRNPQPGTQFALVPNVVLSGLMLDILLAASLDVRIGLGGVALLAVSLRVVLQDWPHRPHYVIGAVAGVGAVIVVTLAPPRATSGLSLDPATGQYFALACGLIGLALAVIGLLDHRQLVLAMSRASSGEADRLPPCRLATTRIMLASAVAAMLLVHFVVLGWPSHAASVMLMYSLMVLLLLIAGGWPDLAHGLRAFKAAARAREAALLARIESREIPRIDVAPMSEIPRPDFWGHLALPVAIACGALVDIPFRGSGFPSVLAIAIAASHLRIATRDWPERKHYLLGALAAAVASVQHMFISQVSALDWAVSFVLLLSIAMLIEGLLDRRLESHPHRQTSDSRHANTI